MVFVLMNHVVDIRQTCGHGFCDDEPYWVEILFVTRSGTGLSRQTEMMWAWFLWGWVLKLYAYVSRVGYYTELHVHRMVCGGWHTLISLLAIHCKKVLGRTIFCLMFGECSNTHRYYKLRRLRSKLRFGWTGSSLPRSWQQTVYFCLFVSLCWNNNSSREHELNWTKLNWLECLNSRLLITLQSFLSHGVISILNLWSSYFE